MSYYYGSTKSILSGCLKDIVELAKSQPELFSFTNLSLSEKIALLNNVPEVASKIKFSSIGEKVYAIEGVNVSASKLITLTTKELEVLSDAQKSRLMAKDPKKYFDIDLYKGMGVRAQGNLFAQIPKRILDAGQPVPSKLTSGDLSTLIQSNKWVFDKHITDFTGFSTYANFWLKLIKHDEKFKEVFIKYASTCSTKTDIREVIRKHPDIIKLLTVDNIAKSKLTVKQWALFIAGMSEKNALSDWEMDDTLREVMMLDLTAEMLTGKSTQSKQLQRAINKLKKQEEEKEEENDKDGSDNEISPEDVSGE